MSYASAVTSASFSLISTSSWGPDPRQMLSFPFWGRHQPTPRASREGRGLITRQFMQEESFRVVLTIVEDGRLEVGWVIAVNTSHPMNQFLG